MTSSLVQSIPASVPALPKLPAPSRPSESPGHEGRRTRRPAARKASVSERPRHREFRTSSRWLAWGTLCVLPLGLGDLFTFPLRGVQPYAVFLRALALRLLDGCLGLLERHGPGGAAILGHSPSGARPADQHDDV